jgi:hypothetical protein
VMAGLGRALVGVASSLTGAPTLSPSTLLHRQGSPGRAGTESSEAGVMLRAVAITAVFCFVLAVVVSAVQ